MYNKYFGGSERREVEERESSEGSTPESERQYHDAFDDVTDMSSHLWTLALDAVMMIKN